LVSDMHCSIVTGSLFLLWWQQWKRISHKQRIR
jgi:hypothetical protein